MKHIKLFEQFLNEGTGNFYNKNANHIFAIGEGDDEDEIQMNYEDGKSAVIAGLSKIGFTDVSHKNESPEDDNRNFPGVILAYKRETKDFGGCDVSVEMEIVLRSGYHQGANVDWNLYYDFNGEGNIDERFTSSELAQKIAYYKDEESISDETTKLGDEAESWLENTSDSMVSDAETVLEEATHPLTVSAKFSSGETHYASARKSSDNVKQ